MKDWYDLEFFHSDKFKKITTFLEEEEERGLTILPDKKDILNAFYYTPFEQVKCVILGQDPYPTRGHAHGLAFSVREGVKPLPKSLINIFRELNDDVGSEPDSGNLTRWAEEGVLLLNTSLTVREGTPGSHSGIGWATLTRDVVRLLNERRNIAYILWGRHAQEFGMFIDQTKHHMIKSPHPSPLSASRGFFGSRPFSRTNEYLTKHNIEPIKW